MFKHIKRLLSHSMIYGLGSALSQALSLLILPLFTAYLTPEDYGVNSILNLFSSFLIGFLCLGLGSAIGPVYYEQDDENYKKRVISNSLLLLLPGILLVCLLLFATPYLSNALLDSPHYGMLVSLSVLSSIYTILGMPLSLALQLQEKSKSMVLINMVTTLINLGLSTVLIAGLKWGILGRFAGHNIGTLVMLLMMLGVLRKNLQFSWDPQIIRGLLKYGLPALPAFLIYFVMQQGNIYILKIYGSLKEIGLYSIGLTFGSALALAVNSFMIAWQPFIWSFKDKQAEARVLFGKILSYYFLFVGSLSLGFYLFAKPLILIFTSKPVYFEAYKLIGLSSTQQFLTGMNAILGVELILAKEIKPVVVIQAIGTVVFVLLSLTLSNLFQGVGAACAFILSQIFIILMMIYWNKREKHRFLGVIYEKNKLFKFIILYILVILIAFAEGNAFSWLHFGLNIVITVGLLAFYWISWLSLSERNWLKAKLTERLSRLRT